MEYMSKEKFEQAEKVEKFKNKMLKYIVYKKRTEAEIRQKFSEEDENMVDEAIEYFKDLNYINDEVYVERAINEFKALKNMSIKEVEYKLLQKGVKKNVVDNYICKNKETMLEYEISSAKSIILKKQGKLEEKDIKDYLYKKGYIQECINIAFDDLKEN